jgi:uncharacterized damage-inducible protein DinB
MQTTLKVLRAFPASQVGLKPAEKSRTAGELVMTLAVEERVLKSLIETGSTDLRLLQPEVPSSMTEIISVWQKAAAANDAILSTYSLQQFERVVHFYGLEIPLGDALWLELFDHIHHRGQFSVYMRLAGAKLPSIYGPTADDPIAIAASEK